MSRFLKFTIPLIASLPFFANAEEAAKYKYEVALSADKNMSSLSIGDSSMAMIEGYRYLDDKILENNDSLPSKIIASITRFFATSFVHVYQHEVGGHGYRARESNKVFNISYDVGIGSGYTRFYYLPTNPPTNYEFAAIHAAGMQASNKLAENLEERMMLDNNINPTYAVAYYHNKMDQSNYIYHLRKTDNASGHDVANYINNVNNVHRSDVLNRSKMRKFAALDYFDPMLYFSTYAFFTSSDMKVPMLKISENVEYLPAFRAVLAPYGPERKFINHIRMQDKYFRIGLSHGKTAKISTHKVELQGFNLYKINNVSLGGEVAYWKQPNLKTVTSVAQSPLAHKPKSGGMLEVNAKMPIRETLDIYGAAGYKTNGFMEGRALDKDAIIRLGIIFKF